MRQTLRLACRHTRLSRNARRAAAYTAIVFSSLFAASSTETAIANGDTRTLYLFHSHTGESIQATFRVNGSYDPAVLEKLNYFLRDWRNNAQIRMDPRLFDVVWEVYRTAGATQPVQIVSAYRSPETNAMLRARSHAVAEFSQHMLGKAMDTRTPGLSMEQVREIGMHLQRGGVGYYGRENFVHLDVGNVRHWPRMSYDQIARLFPDGKTVHLASDGRPQPRYEEARAEIAAHGGIATDVPRPQGGNLFAWLFGGRDRDEEAVAARDAAPTRVAAVAAPAAPARMTAAERRAARAAAAAAPAVAAVEAARADPAPKTQVAALSAASQAAPAQLAAAAPVAAPAAAAAVPLPPRDKPAAPEPPAPELKKALAKDKADALPVASAAPMPPARPAELVAKASLVAMADPPLPPSRAEALPQHAAPAPKASPEAPPATPAPIRTASVDASESLARAASLPVVITRGPKDQDSLPANVLGYAAAAKQQAAPPPIVPARLDRSNYSALTSATPTAEAAPVSPLGQALTGLRQAARSVPDALSAMPSAGYKIALNAATSMLDCARFTKSPGAESHAESSNGVSIAEAPAPRRN